VTGVPSDHDSIRTLRGRLDADATGRLRVALSPDAPVPTGDDGRGVGADVIRLVVAGTDRYARPRRDHGGDRTLIPGAYDAPELARDPGGAADRLREWVEAGDRAAGDAVLVDVVDEGVRYGVRDPGERVVYDERRPVDDSLSAIARDLGE